MVWSKEIWFWPHPDKLGRLGLYATNYLGFYRMGRGLFLKIGMPTATGPKPPVDAIQSHLNNNK